MKRQRHAAGLAERLARGAHHGLVKRREALPGDRRLERVREHPALQQHVAQVGHRQERLAPRGDRATLARLVGLAAVRAADLQRPLQAVADVVVGRLEAEHEQRVLAVAGARLLRLERIDEPAVRRMQPGLRHRTHRVGAAQEVAEAHRPRRAMRGLGLHPHPRLGDHAEDALAAEQHAVGRRACAGARQAPRLPGARRRHRAHGLGEVVDMRPQRREVPTRARRDPATQGRQLEGLREEAQRHAGSGELLLQRRSGNTRLDTRRARDVVDLEHAVQAREVQRDHAVKARRHVRLDAAADARAAAVGHHRGFRAGRPLEHLLHLPFRGREGDSVGDVIELPAKRADGVEERATVRVTHAIGVGRGVRRGETRSRKRGRLGRRLDVLTTEPERLPQDGYQRLGIGPRVREPPPPPVLRTGHCSYDHIRE